MESGIQEFHRYAALDGAQELIRTSGSSSTPEAGIEDAILRQRKIYRHVLESRAEDGGPSPAARALSLLLRLCAPSGNVLPGRDRALALDQYRYLEWLLGTALIRVLGRRVLFLRMAAIGTESGSVLISSRSAPGATSSLVAHLVRAGCDYLGDNLIGFDADSGRLHPFPKAITLTRGAASRFEGILPCVASSCEDTVYMDPGDLGSSRISSGHPAEVVKIFFHELPEAGERDAGDLSRLTAGQTVARLLSLSLNAREVGVRAIDVLLSVGAGATGWQLKVSNETEAASTIERIVRTGNA